ncbi:hypothetical protein D3C81_1976540 [compost metagenome]
MYSALRQITFRMWHRYSPSFYRVPELMMTALDLDLVPPVCLNDLNYFTTAHSFFL